MNKYNKDARIERQLKARESVQHTVLKAALDEHKKEQERAEQKRLFEFFQKLEGVTETAVEHLQVKRKEARDARDKLARINEIVDQFTKDGKADNARLELAKLGVNVLANSTQFR